MERSPHLVAAAEAVRTWIHAQRATWPNAEPLPVVVRAAAVPIATDAPEPVGPGVGRVALPTIDVARAADRLRAWQRAIPWRTLGHATAKAAAAVAILAVVGVGAVWSRGALAKYRAWSRTGTLVIESVPRPSEVRIDDEPAGRTPLTRMLPIGQHVVEFRSGNAVRFMTVDVARGDSTVAQIDWNMRRTGTLQVETNPPGAKVSVDGRARGVTPLTINDVTVGAHTVVLESEEGSVRRQVQIVEGQTEILNDAIFAGWVRVDAPVDVTVSEQGRGLQLDSRRSVLLKAGGHDLLVESAAFGFSEVRHVSVEPGATATLTIDMGTSTLSVVANRQADVQVDGIRVGPAPLTQHPLKIGTHDVVVTDIFGNVRRRSVRVTKAPVQIDVDFLKP